MDPDLRVLARQKANYAAIGIELPVKYERGAFVDASGATGATIIRGPKRDREAQEAFVKGLGELDAKNFRCNAQKGQSNYAPKALREKTLCCQSFTEAELTSVLNRLMQEGRIMVMKDGPPSRPRTFLKLIAPDLPGT